MNNDSNSHEPRNEEQPETYEEVQLDEVEARPSTMPPLPWERSAEFSGPGVPLPPAVLASLFSNEDDSPTEPATEPTTAPTIPAPPPSFDEEHMTDTRRVGRALAMIAHSKLWKQAGFDSIGDFVAALGVDASVVEMVRRLFPDPTRALVQPESETFVRASEEGAFHVSGKWARRSSSPAPSTINTSPPGSPARAGQEGAHRGSGSGECRGSGTRGRSA